MKSLAFAVVMLGLCSVVAGDEAALRAQNQKLKVEIEALKKQNAALESKIQSLLNSQKNNTDKSEDHARKLKAALDRAAAAEASAAADPLSDARFVVITQDQKKGQTQMISVPYDLTMTHGTRQKHVLRTMAIYSQSKADSTQLVLVINSGFTGRSYKEIKTVAFTIGEDTLHLPVASYKSQFRRSGGRNPKRIDDEAVTVSITSKQLTQIATSQKVIGMIGLNRFEMTLEMLTAMNAVRKRLRHID